MQAAPEMHEFIGYLMLVFSNVLLLRGRKEWRFKKAVIDDPLLRMHC